MQLENRDHGTQPLDQLMKQWQINNHALVEHCEEQLNHKQIQKARKGRQLTLHSMQKITRALNAYIVGHLDKEQSKHFHEYLHRQLFNYAKGHNPEAIDLNQALMPDISI